MAHKVIHLSSKSEWDTIMQTDAYYLIDFYADWCGPCKRLGPILEELASKADNWTLVKIDVDQHESISSKYDSEGIPSVYLFKKGEVIDKFLGFKTEDKVVEFLKKNIK